MTASIGILNVGAGDTKIVFDKNNPLELVRAARIVKDMLKRGYALLVEVEPGKFQRVRKFKEDTCEYIIADFDSSVAAKVDLKEAAHGQSGKVKEEHQASDPKATRKRRYRERAISATSARGVAVGRTAGG